MSRRTVAGAAIVVAMIAGAVPAGAVTGGRSSALVLSGKRSVQATFTLRTISRLAADAISVKGGRSYVAGNLRHTTGHHGTGVAIIRSFGGASARRVTGGNAGDDELPAGRYTLTLLTDGPATVTVRFRSGPASRRLRVSRTVVSTLRTGSAALAKPTGAARVVLRGAVGAGQTALLVRFLSAPVRAGRLQECASVRSYCETGELAHDYRLGPVETYGLGGAAPVRWRRNAVFSIDGARGQADVLRAAALVYR